MKNDGVIEFKFPNPDVVIPKGTVVQSDCTPPVTLVTLRDAKIGWWRKLLHWMFLVPLPTHYNIPVRRLD